MLGKITFNTTDWLFLFFEIQRVRKITNDGFEAETRESQARFQIMQILRSASLVRMTKSEN